MSPILILVAFLCIAAAIAWLINRAGEAEADAIDEYSRDQYG